MAEGSSSAPAPESQQFGNIILGGKDAHREESVGTLKLHPDGVGWKSRKTGNIISVSKADLRAAEWIKIPHAYQLKLRARGGFVYKYNGFRSQDKETTKEFLTRAFGLELEEGAISYKGWNWGQATVEHGAVQFSVEGKQTLEVPITDIAQATAQRNEAVVEMVDDDTALPEDEMLVEVRFHLPATAETTGEEDEGTPAENFVANLKQSGDLETAGASFVNLEDIQVQVPRGRYEIELCDKFMKLHGKSYDYKVLYTNVANLYLLPKPDGYHMALSISLEHPLRQGATSYPHIVLQLPRETSLEVEVNLSEAECTSRFGDKLDKYEAGDMPSVVSKVISAFTKRKVQGIKSGGFNADSKDDRTKSIRCSLRAAEGFLYPLDKAFYFLSNKPVLIELDRVASVEFNRVDKAASTAAARTFDITVHMKDMSSNLQFVNLNRSDYKELYRVLTAKKVRIKNIASSGYADGEGGDDDDDDDDPYMARVRREREAAQQAAAAQMEGLDDDDDDDDSEDEDFMGGDASSVDEEYDEGDEEGSEKGFKEKKKKRKKGGSDSDGSDDDASGGGSDSEEEKPLKKKEKKEPKPKKEKPPPAEKKGKAKKDANAPKRGLSAYMIWMNSEGRAQVKAEHPDWGIGDVGKECGRLWKEMGAEAKETWDGKAREDKARYEREMAEYREANPDAAGPSKAPTKKGKAAATSSNPDAGKYAAGIESDTSDEDEAAPMKFGKEE